MDVWVLLTDIVILLASALVLGGIFSRFGQSPIVGYLLAGMLLGGPGSIHTIHNEAHIEAISELGVSLLMFSIGLEFSLAQLMKLGQRRLLGGVLQIAITIVAGGAIAALSGLPLKESVAIGMMVALSSTAVVLRILLERAEVDSAHGRNSVAVLLVQDMAVVPLALAMTLLGTAGEVGDIFYEVGRIVLLASLLIVGLYLVLNRLAVYALGTLTLERNRELTVILAVVVGLGSAGLAHAAEISPALGAFVAGMFLGSSPFATQLRADVSALRVVLLTLFFSSAGMVADPLWILNHWYIVAGVAILIVLGKAAIVAGIFRAFGQSIPISTATGLCLAQIGEFAFVLGAIGEQSGVLSGQSHRVVVSSAIATLLLSAYLVPRAQQLGASIAARLRRRGSVQDTSERLARFVPHVVIIGFGPSGQLAARPFVGRTTRVLVIDLNRDGIRKAREMGFEGLVGDSTQMEVLEHAHLFSAKAIVITIPHFQSAMTTLGLIRRLAPHAHTVVRSRYQLSSLEFNSAGADIVVGDEEEVGDALGRHIDRWLVLVEKSPTYQSMVQVKALDTDQR